MTIKERVNKPTPKFFKVLRNTGVMLAAVSASLLAAPVTLPVVLLKIAGYLAVAGTVAASVSQAVTTEENTVNKKAASSNGQR